MRGAVIFVIAFVVFLVVTLVYAELPPGRQIYNMLGVEDVVEPVEGFAVTDIVVGVFNGVIYGFVVWLAFDILGKLFKSEKKQESKREEE